MKEDAKYSEFCPRCGRSMRDIFPRWRMALYSDAEVIPLVGSSPNTPMHIEDVKLHSRDYCSQRCAYEDQKDGFGSAKPQIYKPRPDPFKDTEAAVLRFGDELCASMTGERPSKIVEDFFFRAQNPRPPRFGLDTPKW